MRLTTQTTAELAALRLKARMHGTVEGFPLGTVEVLAPDGSFVSELSRSPVTNLLALLREGHWRFDCR